MSKPSCSRVGDRLQIFALVIAVAVVFGNSLFNGFVWDDTMIFINHEPYRNFDLKRILLSPPAATRHPPSPSATAVCKYQEKVVLFRAVKRGRGAGQLKVAEKSSP